MMAVKRENIMTRKLILAMLTTLMLVALISLPVPSASLGEDRRRGPQLDELMWILIKESGAAVDALLSGEIDMVDLTRPGDVEAVKAAGFPVIARPYARIVCMAINHNRSITGDLAFRKAIAHLLPKSELLATYQGPLGTYETNVVPAAFGDWYNPNVPDMTEYDPALATHLLNQAGYTVNPETGIRIDPATGEDMRTLDLCYYPDIPERGITWMEPFSEELEAVGIPTRLVPVAFGTGEWYTKLILGGEYDLWLAGWAWAPGSPSALEALYASWAFLPMGFYHNETFDDLIYETMHTFNHTRAVECCWKAEEIAVEDICVIPCWSAVTNTAINPDLVGFGVGPYIDISTAATLLPRWKDKVGGTLRIVMTDEASNMISGFDMSARADIFWSYLLDSAIDYNPYTGAMMPWIVQEWSTEGWSDTALGVTDGMVVYFKIKDDVYWQDGIQFTADDIKFNFEYWRDKSAPRGADQVADLVKIDVLNPYEMKIYYSTVKPITFPETYAYQVCRLPKHIYNDNVTLYGEPAGPMDLQFEGQYGVPEPSTFWPTEHTNPFNSSLTCLTGIGPWIYPPGGWEKGKSFRMVANRNYHCALLITDINFDYKVDMHDLNMVTDALGSKVGDPEYSLNIDFNGDGAIDDTDVSVVEADLGKTWGGLLPFTFSNLDVSPADVETGEESTITVTVENEGDYKGTYQAILKIDGHPEAYEDVTLDGGASTTVTFKVSKDTPGTYDIEVGGQTATLTVSGLAPAKFSVTSLSVSPLEVETGENATITVTVENTGDVSGEYTVELNVNGETEDTKEVTLDGGESTTVTFKVSKDTPGTYDIEVGGKTETITVTAPPTPPYWLYAGIIVAIIVIAIIIWRWRRT